MKTSNSLINKETTSSVLLTLIRTAILGEFYTLTGDIHWQNVYKCSCQQGVAAIAFDGFKKYYDSGVLDIPAEVKLKWYGTTTQCEKRYDKQLIVIKQLRDYLTQYDIRLMVLKGWGLSLLYPEPRHRSSADIDVYMFGNERLADDLLTSDLSVEVDASHHHHTVFSYGGVTVENHYDFINVYAETYAPWLEQEFKRLATDDKHLYEDGIWLPGPTLNALFMLRHSAQHFASEKMPIKQVLDWALFSKKYGDLIDWAEVRRCAEYVGMIQFLECLNECADSLLQPDYEFKESTAKRVWDDIWSPSLGKEPKGIARYSFKLKRWWQGRWKRKLVYKENIVKQFLVLLRSHLIKPKA